MSLPVTPRRFRLARRSSSSSRRAAAFTLIELLLVLVILGVLAAVVVPKLAGRAQESKISGTKSTLHNVRKAVEIFESDNDRIPTNDEGLRGLVESPSAEMKNWHKQLDAMPVDAWGNPVIYRVPGSNGKAFDII